MLQIQELDSYAVDSDLAEAAKNAKNTGGVAITVENSEIRPIQNAIAQATIWLPFLGTCVALVYTYWFGVGRTELLLCAAGFVITSLGIEFGFHRALAHRAFDTFRGIKVIFGIFGSMAAEGRVLYWVASHRRHHIYSDTPGDPHSPHVRRNSGRIERLSGWRGLLHAHVTHMVTDEVTNCTLFAKDIQRDATLRWVSDWYLAFVALGYVIPAIVGVLVYQTVGGVISCILWGGFVRMFLVHHTTWSVASFCHLFGTSRFDTKDRSRNNVWLAVPSFGSAWQNNHHAFPNSAHLGLRWWEIDLTALFIKLLESCRLVWNVRRPDSEQIEKRLLRIDSVDMARETGTG